MTKVPGLKICVALLISLLTVFLPAAGVQAQEENAGETAKIVVYLIEASNGEPGVDPQIKDIVKQFEGAFGYSTYKLVSKIPKKLAFGTEEKIAIPGSREMRLKVLGYKDNRLKLNVKILEKPARGKQRQILDTEFRIVEGGTILIGGYSYRKGKLIVAISSKM